MVPDGVAHGEGLEVGFAAEVLDVAGEVGEGVSMGEHGEYGYEGWWV